jgi:ankyrin repeat protein
VPEAVRATGRLEAMMLDRQRHAAASQRENSSSLAANGLIAVEEHGSLAAAAAATDRRAGRAMTKAVDAMRRRDTRLVTRLLMRGVVHSRDRDAEGMTLLHHAAMHGLARIAEGLVRDFGADVNAQSVGGDSALHLAYDAGYRELAATLERLGADGTAANAAGFTPFDMRRDV